MLTLPLTHEDLVERVRRATGGPLLREGGDIVVRGQAEHLGSQGTFLWRFGVGPRFRREVKGISRRVVGGDGNGVWILDASERARALEWGEADQARLMTALLTGDWLTPEAGMTSSPKR